MISLPFWSKALRSSSSPPPVSPPPITCTKLVGPAKSARSASNPSGRGEVGNFNAKAAAVVLEKRMPCDPEKMRCPWSQPPQSAVQSAANTGSNEWPDAGEKFQLDNVTPGVAFGDIGAG
jgi:hypothetical protein